MKTIATARTSMFPQACHIKRGRLAQKVLENEGKETGGMACKQDLAYEPPLSCHLGHFIGGWLSSLPTSP